LQGIDAANLFQDRPEACVMQVQDRGAWFLVGWPPPLPYLESSVPSHGYAFSKEESQQAAERAFPSLERQVEMRAFAKRAWKAYDAARMAK
jgi:hypothetical protein